MTDTRGVDDVITRAAAGDAAALGELWRAHQHLLLRYFRGRGMNDPEDLASVVWIEVARGLPTFSGDAATFRRWLFTIAARRRIDEIRRDRRRRERDDVLLAVDQPTPAPGADEDADRAASLDRALGLVSTLPPDQAEAILLRVVADLTVADVADIMERTEGSVRVLVHRGLKRLGTEFTPRPAPTGGDTPQRPGHVTNPEQQAMYAS